MNKIRDCFVSLKRKVANVADLLDNCFEREVTKIYWFNHKEIAEDAADYFGFNVRRQFASVDEFGVPRRWALIVSTSESQHNLFEKEFRERYLNVMLL